MNKIKFFLNSPFGIYHTYSSEFFMGRRTYETSFLYCVNCIVAFLLISSIFSNPAFLMNLPFRKQEKLA